MIFLIFFHHLSSLCLRLIDNTIPHEFFSVYQSRRIRHFELPMFYVLYGLGPNSLIFLVNSLATCANFGPSDAETHSNRNLASSRPKSSSMRMIAHALFSALRFPSS